MGEKNGTGPNALSCFWNSRRVRVLAILQMGTWVHESRSLIDMRPAIFPFWVTAYCRIFFSSKFIRWIFFSTILFRVSSSEVDASRDRMGFDIKVETLTSAGSIFFPVNL